MNKFLLSFFFLFSPTLFALYTGNPAQPYLIDEGFFLSKDLWYGVKAGYQGDWIFNRRLDASSGATGRIDDFNAKRYQGVLTLNIMERGEIYGSIGAMNAYISHRPHIDHKQREYQTNDHLTWGVGTRIIIFQWCDTTLGVGGSYQHAGPRVMWDSLDGEAFSSHAHLRYNEWQVTAGLAQHIDLFTPYIAAKYSDVRAKLEHISSDMQLGHSHFKMTSRQRFGMALGVTLTNGRFFDLTFEASVFDEESAFIAANIAF